MNPHSKPVSDSWDAIRLPSFDRTAFTPGTANDFSGIVIWVPPQVPWTKNLRVPVFGIVQLTQAEVDAMRLRDPHPLRAAILGAMDAKHHDPHVGNVVSDGVLFPAAPGIRIREYFNVELFETTGAPKNPGRYFVFASLGQHTAPVVEVEVTP